MIDKISFIKQLQSHSMFNAIYPLMVMITFQRLLQSVCAVSGLAMLREIQSNLFLLRCDP